LIARKKTDRQKGNREMKAYVSIQNYGPESETELFCKVFNTKTLFHAYVNQDNTIVIVCRSYELGQLFSILQADELFNWIEYTVQFEC